MQIQQLVSTSQHPLCSTGEKVDVLGTDSKASMSGVYNDFKSESVCIAELPIVYTGATCASSATPSQWKCIVQYSLAVNYDHLECTKQIHSSREAEGYLTHFC